MNKDSIKYSICIVDDKIPAHNKMNDAVRLNSNNLEYLKNNVPNWDDQSVKEFIENLLEQRDWNLSGFTNPNILINCIEEELYRPDIVIFDWDYSATPVGSDQVEKSLLEILQQSFSIIFIFTGVDKLEEIAKLMKNPPFSNFQNRVKIKDKNVDNSTQLLCKEIEEARKKNFSFKFGAELRKKSLEAVDKILIELGKVSIEHAVKYFKLSDDTNRDMIDFIGERFKNQLNITQFVELPEVERGDHIADLDIARQLWSNRLYFYPDESEPLVRKGDIIKNKKNNEFFIVVTADCDLARFWNKNYGYINLLPIHEIISSKEYIKKQVTMTRKENELKKNIKFASFSASIYALPGVLFLPFLRFDQSFKYFVLFPKELRSEKVEMSQDDIKESFKVKHHLGLRYGECFEYKRIATISEPFLTPLIQHIFGTISGYGTPDYPDAVKELINKNFRKIFE